LVRGQALLQRVGLSRNADAYPHQLCGGQKQRVATIAKPAQRTVPVASRASRAFEKSPKLSVQPLLAI
jgi:predicted ABC-type transport system involved in lysophospholipase L1 biosynthesis ATPase subunit